jgi:ABC-type transport system involved in multi-copper enzyme maturation permease subunit
VIRVIHPVVVAETVRRIFTNLGFLIFAAFLLIVALAASGFDHPGAMWPTLIAGLAIILGSGPIGPEFSSGTLQLILVKPVRRWVYLLSRVTGVVLAVWAVAILGAVAELAGRFLWSDATVWPRVAGAMVNCFADAILTASLLVLLGSLTRAYFNVAIYLGVRFSLMALATVLGFMRVSRNALGQILEQYPAIEKAVARVDQTLYPDFPPSFQLKWIGVVLLTAAIALALACIAFRSREVPYGAD